MGTKQSASCTVATTIFVNPSPFAIFFLSFSLQHTTTTTAKFPEAILIRTYGKVRILDMHILNAMVFRTVRKLAECGCVSE